MGSASGPSTLVFRYLSSQRPPILYREAQFFAPRDPEPENKYFVKRTDAANEAILLDGFAAFLATCSGVAFSGG